jgi:hypothetical protein
LEYIPTGEKMLNRKAWIVIGFCTVALLLTIFVFADVKPAYAESNCYAYADLPQTNLSSFTGSGRVICTAVRPSIKVVYNVEFQGDLQHYAAKTKTCPNTDTCTWTLTVNKVGTRKARSATSGYAGTWQGGIQSGWANP